MNNLFIYVEGFYDQLFVEKILVNFLLTQKSTIVFTIPYAQKSPILINKDIKSKQNHNYIFLSDLDRDQTPCISSKKDYRIRNYPNLDYSKIIIAKEEIESWYLAGIDNSLDDFKDFNIPDNTDLISKEDFGVLLQQNSIQDKTNFCIEVCKHFNFDLAIQRNNSFRYFLNKLNCL